MQSWLCDSWWMPSSIGDDSRWYPLNPIKMDCSMNDTSVNNHLVVVPQHVPVTQFFNVLKPRPRCMPCAGRGTKGWPAKTVPRHSTAAAAEGPTWSGLGYDMAMLRKKKRRDSVAELQAWNSWTSGAFVFRGSHSCSVLNRRISFKSLSYCVPQFSSMCLICLVHQCPSYGVSPGGPKCGMFHCESSNEVPDLDSIDRDDRWWWSLGETSGCWISKMV